MIESLRDRIDRFTPLDEYPECRHLGPFRGDIEPFTTPGLELVDVPAGEVVQVVDTFLPAPVDEEPEPGPVAFDCLGSTVPFPVVEIHLNGLARCDGLKGLS